MFHRRPLDTIWHRLPIRHVSFKRRKQSMKDTRKIERSSRFPPTPASVRLGGFFGRLGFSFAFARSDPTGSPLPAGLPLAPLPVSRPGPGLPRTREPNPRSGARRGERTFRPCGSERAGLPPFPSVAGFFFFFFLLEKALNGEIWAPPPPRAQLRAVCAGAVRAALGRPSAAGEAAVSEGGDTHTPTHGVGGSVELLGAGGDPSPRRGVSAVSAGEQESGGARVPQS